MKLKKVIFLSIIVTIVLLGCVQPSLDANAPLPPTSTATNTATATVTPTATNTPIPQHLSEPVFYEAGNFPEGISPLSGLQVSDPALLEQPALLLSVPHFPIAARPQSGLSFTPWVFEFLIGEGTTRFLAVFYGEQPFTETPIVGDCEIRTEEFVSEGKILGNFVWYDQDGDGIQNSNEKGVSGVCIRLYDEQGELIEETSSDSNGYYGFSVEIEKSYQVEFLRPEGMSFSPENIGNEDSDSDANSGNGMTGMIAIKGENLYVDAGFVSSVETKVVSGQVGPVRSGRLLFKHIQNFFQNSCLIFAGATDLIVKDLPYCAQVHNTENGAGSMLDIERLIKISEKNAIRRGSNFNYASNSFSEIPPTGGFPANQLDFFVSSVNQTQWIYDPLSTSWARYVDNASEETIFTRDTDKLTGREISFENIIVIFVEHEVIRPRIADMHLEMGQLEGGYLFRDGQAYPIQWSTRATDYEQSTGLRRPIAFQNLDGNPIPLRPGQTWILIATPYSEVSEVETGHWKVRVYSPPGFGEY